MAARSKGQSKPVILPAGPLESCLRTMPNPTDTPGLVSRLRQHPVLGHLGADGLAALVQQAAVVRFAERAQIFAQGDDSRSVMAVAEGYVKLSAVTLNGREVVLDLAGPGSVFGELAVLNGWPRVAPATALADRVLPSIDHVRHLPGGFAQAPAEQADQLQHRRRRPVERTRECRTIDMPAAVRIAKALLRLAALHSRPVGGGPQIELALSQREPGGMTGLIREIINRYLGNWRDTGWLRLSDRGIILTDVQALRALVPDYDLD